MRKLNGIEDESATGGNRPGAGAAPVPKPEPPHTKPGFRSSASSFRRTGRSVTQWRGARRIRTTTKKGGDARSQWFAVRATIIGLPIPGGSQSLRGASGFDSARQEGRKPDDQPPSPHDGIAGRYGVLSALSDAGNPSPAADGGSDSPPDISGEFQSEMAALRAYYAARIGAAQRSLSAGDVSAIVQALLNEQTVALRSLAERWRAATERQKQEKPQRPTGLVQRKDDGLKPL
jgi:hypothetical protein